MGIRPFSEAEYAIIVLHNLKRLIRHTSYPLSFIPPRDLTKEITSSHEVLSALDVAIASLQVYIEEQER